MLLRLLGETELQLDDKCISLERKTAGLLAYLALEGSSTRQVLAGLLWPNSGEKQARTNLRKVLIRLKPFELIVTNQDKLSLTANAQLDLHEMQQESLEGSFLELLADHSYDDCVDFADWLYIWRERLKEQQSAYLSLEVNRLEAEGAFTKALPLAKQLLLLEPISELHYRRLMRLQYALGDRAAALETFKRCAETIEQLFKLEPSPETLALAEEIRTLQAEHVQRFSFKQSQHLPLSLLRPPLVAREDAWARLELAWSESQAVFISGDAGTGKSRLAQDFLHEQEGMVYPLKGQSDDSMIPFRVFTRLLRSLSLEGLTAWQLSVLSRLVPELSDKVVDSSMKQLASQLCRFLSLQGESINLLCDDLQFWDKESQDLVFELIRLGVKHLKFMIVFRPKELASQTHKALMQIEEEKKFTKIQLKNLTMTDLEDLVSKLELDFEDLDAALLFQLSSGNPLLLTEILKNVYTAETKSDLPKTLKELFAKRFSELPEQVNQLLWAMSLTGGKLKLELIAAMLKMNALNLHEALRVLEEQQFLHGQGLHDLVKEAVVSSLPSALKELLHERAAAYLKEAEPLEAAEHYLAASKLELAAECWFEAARRMHNRGLVMEPVAILERAVRFDSEAKLDMSLFLAELYGEVDRYEEAFDLACSLAPKLKSVRAKSKLLYVLTDSSITKGQFGEAAAFLEELKELAEYSQDRKVQNDSLNMRMRLLTEQGHFEEALVYAEALLSHYREQSASAALATTLSNIGILYTSLDRVREGLRYHYEAKAIAEDLQLKSQLFMAAGNLAVAHYMLGENEKAIDLSLEALATGEFHGYDTIRNNLAFLYMDAARYEKAIELSLELAEQGALPQDRILAQARLSELYSLSQQTEHIVASLDKAIELSEGLDFLEPRVRVIINCLKYGSDEQKQKVRQWLSEIDMQALRHDFREELKSLGVI